MGYRRLPRFYNVEGFESMDQLSKNTVKADNQLDANRIISYIHAEGTGTRVLFVGNSITRHGVKRDIGWENDWGMAASAMEKDYVHLVVKSVLKKDPNASFCVLQAAQWETNCYHGETLFPLFKPARDFCADILIMRVAENCPRALYNCEQFQKEYGKLISYLDLSGKAQKVITTSFWKRNEDEAIRLFAKSHGYPVVELGDLGEEDAMKAIGRFEHTGVANHPGDLGMKIIAERISNAFLSDGWPMITGRRS